jgi:hypothetical protein
MAGEADELSARGEHERAAELYVTAAQAAPDADELTFWAGLGVAAQDLAGGVALVREAIAVKESWLILLARLSPELAPTAAAVLAELER